MAALNRGQQCVRNRHLTKGTNRIARSILTFRFEALPSKVSSGASPRSEPFEFTRYTLRHTFWDAVPVSQNLILAQRHYDAAFAGRCLRPLSHVLAKTSGPTIFPVHKPA